MSLKCLVGRMGGKSLSKKTIVDKYFPKDYECMTYVEPFVGGGSIFFYKNPSVFEVVNDLDNTIYTIFKGAKTYKSEDLKLVIDKTYTKEEFNTLRDSKPTNDFDGFCRAYVIIIRSIMSNGLTWRDNTSKFNANLEGYKERLEDVEIYNVDYKEMIDKYDSEDTFFYLDPPYENSKGLYKNDVVSIDEMYNILSNIKGKFLMSYNNSERARELFKKYNIYEIQTKYSRAPFGHNKNKNKNTNVTELLISNY
jgi:DNA adenine methylase